MTDERNFKISKLDYEELQAAYQHIHNAFFDDPTNINLTILNLLKNEIYHFHSKLLSNKYGKLTNCAKKYHISISTLINYIFERRTKNTPEQEAIKKEIQDALVELGVGVRL